MISDIYYALTTGEEVWNHSLSTTRSRNTVTVNDFRHLLRVDHWRKLLPSIVHFLRQEVVIQLLSMISDIYYALTTGEDCYPVSFTFYDKKS